MSGHRSLLSSVPAKVAVVILSLGMVFSPYRYIVDGPEEAFNVLLTTFLLLWIVAYGFNIYQETDQDDFVSEDTVLQDE